MINTLFFDLDGTLLPMDQKAFIKDYFTRLAKVLVSKGIDPETSANSIRYGTKLMMKNRGPHLNEDLFWQGFTQLSSLSKTDVSELVDHFYRTDFQNVIHTTQPIDDIPQVIQGLKDKGYRLVLATNPLFPQAATHSRVRWANLELDMFEEITTFEFYHASKPSLEYYQEIMDKVNVKPHEVMMIGNDVTEDLAISALGSQTYLITDNLINRDNRKVDANYVGSMEDFRKFAKELPIL